MKRWRSWLSAILAATLLFSGIGSFAETAVEVPVAEVGDQAVAILTEGQLTQADIEALGATVHTQDDRVTFVDGPCTDETVAGVEDAARIVDSMIALLGGDGRTQFEPWRTLTDANGDHYYVFQQMHAGTTVLGGAVKLVTDAGGNMLGLVGCVKSELPDVESAEGITAEEAGALVLQHMADANMPQAELMEERTEKVILPVTLKVDFTLDEIDESNRYVWAVYTNNPDGNLKTGSDLPYLAHYVTMGGEYLYSLPTILPGDEASAAGYNAAYVFEFMEPADYTGTVKLSDGTEREISVQLMQDSRTGMYYLGNLERRIVVADCFEFLYNDGRVRLEASADNTGWDDTCLLSLYNYCRAWDYYKEFGWVGGDGQGTPMLILKDFCNSDHVPVNNAAYAGRFYGWQVFLSSAANDLSQCLDVLAHEFTHCVTGSVMTYNAYKNDYGAINEAMSDIQGNLCEMMTGATEDTTWMMGENSSGGAVRSMSDPHSYKQPEFSWDLYYVPNVKEPTEINDRGGVHTNSSLLNNLAWRLCEKGGMTLKEARAFWFAVDCAMVPDTDYPQLSELMPWVLKNLGMEKYSAALEEAMDATRIRSNAMPDTFDDDRALLTLTLPDQEAFMDGNWGLFIISVDIEGLKRRLDEIEKSEGGYTAFFNDLLSELYDGSEQPAEQEESLSPDELAMLLFEAIEEAIEDSEAGDTGDSAETAPEEAETTKESKAEIVSRLYEKLKENFGDLFYMGTGTAGQDGRTVRMVCRPGLTLPVLFRLEVDSDMQTRSVGLAIYTFDRWIDLGSIIAPWLLEQDSQADNPAEGVTEEWLNFLLDLIGESDSGNGLGDMFAKLGKLYKRLTDPQWLCDHLFISIEPGAVCEVPADGLEAVATLKTEDYPALKEMFSAVAQEDGGEAGAGE